MGKPCLLSECTCDRSRVHQLVVEEERVDSCWQQWQPLPSPALLHKHGDRVAEAHNWLQLPSEMASRQNSVSSETVPELADFQKARRLSQKQDSQSRRHSYVPFIPPRESKAIRDRVAGTSDVFKDCKHIYPYIKEDGTKMMVSEYDFHVKMQKKYKALLGDKYVYPVMDVAVKLADVELIDVSKDDKALLDLFIPHEVEVMIPGGLKTIKKDVKENLFVFANAEELVPLKIKAVTCKEMKEFQGKQDARASSNQFCVPTNTGDISADSVIEHFIAGMEVPTVRRLKNVFGFSEGAEEILSKLRESGLLEKYEVKIDDEQYFKNFVNNKSRVSEFGFDYRRLMEEQKQYGAEEWEAKPAEPPKSLDSSFDSEKPADTSFESEKPSDTSFESEIDIEPYALKSKGLYGTAPSCDSGLGLESPPTSPSSKSKSPSPLVN